MRIPIFSAPIAAIAAAACAPAAPADSPAPPQDSAARAKMAREAITAVLDSFHDAAAKADEERYFGHFADDGVFLGTDATERWDVAAFRAYARPHFAKGKAWSFRAIRRAITIGADGAVAWFDEDLETKNLGPSRGSGVLVKRGGAWRISQYNLAITVPNDRFDAVKRAAAGEAPKGGNPPAQ